MSTPESPRGRGALSNPSGRFEAASRLAFDDGWGSDDEAPPVLRTEVTAEITRNPIAENDSPDVPFNKSLNPYKGCEHGCVYCFARPTHAYLGYSPGLDFESRIVSKPEMPERLRERLASKGYRCEVLALGANTDPYQPVERDLRITRRTLEVLAEFAHPVAIVTKSSLVLRDLDLLAPMAERRLAAVMISVTTLDRALARRMEPRAATPARRLETIAALRDAGVPVGVLASPMIPNLNDHELEAILDAAHDAGARAAGYIMVRLPHELKTLFSEWLERHYPGRARHVLSILKQAHDGELYRASFGTRMRGSGAYADMLAQRYAVKAKALGLWDRHFDLDTRRFAVPPHRGQQLRMF